METRMLLWVGVFVFGISGLAAADQLDVPGQYLTIQAAIDAARVGDTVVVADGVYTGPGNRDIRFLGKAITVRSENGPVNCIIDCQGTQQDPHRGFDFDGGETAETVLDGFTITNGSTPPGAILDEFNGAGILFRDGSPTVKNCIITNNWAGCWGGAMCCSLFGDSNPTIINCTIADNYSNAEGAWVSWPSFSESVSSMAGEVGPCSAWPRRSVAAISASQESSAMIKVSVGPASRSMPTWPNSCRFASATYIFPGPTRTSTGVIESVPSAIAPTA